MEHDNSVSKATAWVEHILSLHPQAKKAIERESPVMGGNFKGPGDHSSNEMLFLAPAHSPPLRSNLEQRDVLMLSDESASARGNGNRPESSQIDSEEVADRVYRLMRNDLILERERAI